MMIRASPICSADVQGGQHHLGNEQLRRQIDLDLTAEDLDRNRLQWPWQGGARIIDQTKQRSRGIDHLARSSYGVLIEQIHDHRRDELW